MKLFLKNIIPPLASGLYPASKHGRKQDRRFSTL